MEKLTTAERNSANLVAANIAALQQLFPELVTEGKDGAVVNVDVPGVLYGELFLDLRPHELATAHRLQDAFFRFVQREDA